MQKQSIDLGLGKRKPVLGIYNQVKLKPACSATEASYNIEILHIASLPAILNNANNNVTDQTAWVVQAGLCLCYLHAAK